MLTAVHTPGHAPDHLCLWDPGPRVLYCGDLAQSGNSVWIPYDLRGDLADYLDSLTRVLDIRPARLLPSHGPVIEAPEALLRRYIEHRLARERQIVEAIAEGASTAEDITGAVYAALPEKMLPMAKQSVLSHLAKLAREGRVRLDGDAWNIMSA
jgi:glyoxylase-like metal-dependent hydrolase (beta-lactamase superfamily II)